MSNWRKVAMETFPEFKQEWQSPDITIYGVFFELLPLVRELHQSEDRTGLIRLYTFAEWCLHHKSRYIQNAAAVAFYEHLVDSTITLQAIPAWVKPVDFADLLTLFAWRLEKKPEALYDLLKRYNAYRKTNFKIENIR